MVFSMVRPMANWPQWFVGLSLSLAQVLNGFAKSWTSPYVAQLTSPNGADRPKLTGSEASWIASLLFLGKLCGCILGSTIQEFTGRKKTLLYSGGSFALGWALVLFATSVPWLYASRFLCGLSLGMILATVTLFLGEVADPKIRGTLILWNMAASTVGGFVGTAMGTFLSLRVFSYVSVAVSGSFMVLFCFVAESPYYYIAKGDPKRAEKSLQWYKRREDVQSELDELEDFVGSTRVSLVKRLNEFKKPEHRRNLMVMCSLNLFIYCAGANTIDAYAETILTESKVLLKPSTIVMALTFSYIIASFVATTLVDRFGRRPLLIASGLGIGTAQALLSAHFHMLSLNLDPATISWLPAFALLLHCFSLALGLGPIPFVLIGELFPPTLKTLASLCFTASGALLNFAITKTFPSYVNLVGERFVFLSFALSALCSVVFTHFCVPETNQLTLINIQENLKRDKKRNNISTGDLDTNIRVNKCEQL